MPGLPVVFLIWLTGFSRLTTTLDSGAMRATSLARHGSIDAAVGSDRISRIDPVEIHPVTRNRIKPG